jgi:hypothetical protein
MSRKESNIKQLIHDYLLDEGLLRGKVSDPKLNFGFQFIFPLGKDPLGRPVGRNMVVFQPQNKGLIIISLGTQISPPHINALNSLKANKKMEYFMELRKLFLLRDMFYRIDIKNHRYEISDQIFLNKDGLVSKKTFYNSVRRVFNCAVLSNIILSEYCVGKIKPEDFTKTKEFRSGPDFSLYT